jgi:drug/metabolite transporter (DMT)-like permease
MDAVLLALTSAFLFGAMTVALRVTLRTYPAADLGAVVTTGVGLLVVVSAALVAIAGGDPATAQDLGVFALAGVLSPGLSSILFLLAIRDAGSSRASVVVGGAPLVAATLAILLLDEDLRAPLVVGALLIVVAGALLVGEPVRPEHFRAVGMLFAAVATVLFSTRDVILRWYSQEGSLGSLEAAAASLVAGWLVVAAYTVVARRGRLGRSVLRPALAAFVPAGLLFGISYVLLFEAYYRGEVTVVSPLVATETLWTVLLSALVLRRSELVGPRLVLGAALVVAGGALIGAYR